MNQNKQELNKIIVDTLLKHYPGCITVEGIKKLVHNNVLDFEAGAYATEAVNTENILGNPGSNDKRMEDRVPADKVKLDCIYQMCEKNDSLLYSTYQKAADDFRSAVAQMVEKHGSNFSHLMDHIDTLLDPNEKDQEIFNKIRKENIKII